MCEALDDHEGSVSIGGRLITNFRFADGIFINAEEEEEASVLIDRLESKWKVSIFKIVDQRIKFYSQNTNLLPPKPKSTFRHLKQGIQDFHRKYVLVPADKAANNVVVV